MTDMITGTGTGTGTVHLRPSAPGTGGDSPALAAGDRSLGTAGTSPALVPGTVAHAGTGTAPVPGDTQGPAPAPTGDSGGQSQNDKRGPWHRFRDWRDQRSVASLESQERREEQRAERDRRDRADQVRRDQLAAAALAAALDTQRTAKAKGQAAKKQVTKGDSLDGPPIPGWMQGIGLWLDRTFGSMPLVAPLIVSGWFTFRAGYESNGMALPGILALLLSVAFEGGVWKLSRINEKSLVAGYSTIALRIGMGLYLTIISSVIYWHETMKVGGLAHLKDANWIPAAAAALLSSLGVYIQGRAARWARRHALEAAGKMDKQAIKLSGISWLFTPVINIKVMRHAVKYRLDSAVDAVRDYRLFRAAGKPKVWPQVPAIGTDGPTDITAILKSWGLDIAALTAGQGQGLVFGPAPVVPGTGPAPVPAASGTGPTVPAQQSLSPIPGAVPPQSPANGTGPGSPAVPPVPQDNGTGEGTEEPAVMIQLADGTEIDQAKLLDYAQRHRIRLETVLAGRPDDADDTFDWTTCPLKEITTKAVKEAGGFAKQEWAGEIRKLILAARVGYNPYSMV